MKQPTSKESQMGLANHTGSAACPCPSMEEFFSSAGITSEEEKSAFIGYFKELFSITYNYLNSDKNDQLQ